jgi:nucleotide-binding universal stress UspA family protein
VLRHTTCALLVVHTAPEGDGPVRVLVATDGSGQARGAASMLATLADPSCCDVTVVSVVPGEEYDGRPPPTLSERDTYEARMDGAGTAVDDVAALLRPHGFRAVTTVALGSARSRIEKTATEGPFDVVVVGSRGLAPIKRVLLGSVSNPVARRCPAALVSRR